MKKILGLMLLVSLVFACKNEPKESTETTKTEETKKEVAYASFGDKIEADGAKSTKEAVEIYKNLKPGDTVVTKFTAKINSVCQTKGCWMRLDLGDDSETMVRFKDYGFFMPLNAEGDVIVNGKAYVSEISVDELRHYAKDAGKTKEEIEKITEPEMTLSFEADGVLLAQ